MKSLFIKARKKSRDINLSALDKLPGKKISLAATVQYSDLIPIIKKYLEKKSKKTTIKNINILGCNSAGFDKKADTLLLIADGRFHALNNAFQLQREIYIFNTKNLEKISKNQIEKINKKTKAKISKFLLSENIGILISTKSGQKTNPEKLKLKIKKLGKTPYLFKSNNINVLEFENFPQIPIYINTACPGLAIENPKILNLSDILDYI
jgi:diphthamide biosynthesis enzyme Dph1/Dph2-like protein